MEAGVDGKKIGVTHGESLSARRALKARTIVPRERTRFLRFLFVSWRFLSVSLSGNGARR